MFSGIRFHICGSLYVTVLILHLTVATLFFFYFMVIYIFFFTELNLLTLFRMAIFGAAQRWGPKSIRLPKICHTYPTMMKFASVIPYLQKILKICESRDTPLDFCWHKYIFAGNWQILLYQKMQIQIVFW